jgi:hypothetical protein
MEREHEKVLNDTLEAQKKLLKVEKTFEVSPETIKFFVHILTVFVFRNGGNGRRRRRPRRRS